MTRALALIALGVVYNGLFKFDFENLRIASVLGRIGIAWAVAALLYIHCGVKTRVVVAVVILLGYWGLSMIVAPDAVAGADPLSKEGCLVGYIDRLLLPGKLIYGNFDPEGLLSTLPAVVTAMLGNFAGEWVRQPQERVSGDRKAALMAVAGVVMAVVAWAWNFGYTSKQKMNNKTGKPDAWSWAWGQNDIYATPVSMARAISIVANDGKMPVTRYLMDSKQKSVDLLESSSCDLLKDYLHFTAKEHDKFDNIFLSRLGGKTGTPERTWKESKKKVYNDFNDGWYICFIEQADINHNSKNKDCLAIAVRIERLNDSGSGRAVRLTKEVVIKALQDLKYI